MIDRRKVLGKRIWVEGEGTKEFSDLGFDNCRDFKVIVVGLLREVVSANNFGLETLDTFDVGWLRS